MADEHKCSVDKLDVRWECYRETDPLADNTKLPPPKWRAKFTCSCGKEYTWERLVELIPFKELGGQVESSS